MQSNYRSARSWPSIVACRSWSPGRRWWIPPWGSMPPTLAQPWGSPLRRGGRVVAAGEARKRRLGPKQEKGVRFLFRAAWFAGVAPAARKTGNGRFSRPNKKLQTDRAGIAALLDLKSLFPARHLSETFGHRGVPRLRDHSYMTHSSWMETTHS